MTKKITKKILQKIKQEKIKPRPKFIFILKNLLFWFFFIISIILGGKIFAFLIFIFQSGDFDIFWRSENFLKLFFLSLPFFYLGFLFLLIQLAVFNLQKTKKGYRFKLLPVFFGSVFISFLLGILFFSFLGEDKIENLENALAQKAPFFHLHKQRKEKIWASSKNGFLRGIILKIDQNKKTISLKDSNQKEWEVDFSNAFLPPKFKEQIRINQKIKIIGKEITKNKFKAIAIKPARKKGFNKEKSNKSEKNERNFLLPSYQ